MPGNCNFGIQQANYPYVAILHDGDRFKRDLIEQWYNALTMHETVGFVFNSIATTDANEKLLVVHDDFNEGLIPGDYLLKKVFFRRWGFDSPVFGEAMIKKDLVAERGLLKKRYGFYADVDLWMELLQTHDAYYCSDILITGPEKTIQPHLFDDNLIKEFSYLYRMQKEHRIKAYRNRPVRLAKEFVILWIQSLLCLNYRLLLLIKNFSFGAFIKAAGSLKNNLSFIASWATMLVFYPVLFPILKLFKLLKKGVFQPRRKNGADRGYQMPRGPLAGFLNYLMKAK